MHFSFFKTRHFVQIRVLFLTLKHRKQMHDRIEKIWIDQDYIKIIPIRISLPLVLTIVLTLIPIINIDSLQEIFFHPKKVLLFLPRRIEGRSFISKDRDQKKLFYCNFKKDSLEKESYFQNRFLRKQDRKIFNILSKDRENIFLLFNPSLFLREFSRWEIGLNLNRRYIQKIDLRGIPSNFSLIRKNRNFREKATFLKCKQKWQEIFVINPKVIWLKMVLKTLERKGVLFLNSHYSANSFEQNWKRKKIKNWSNLQLSEFITVRKFRFRTYQKIKKNKMNAQVSSLLIFVSHRKNINIFQERSFGSKFPFSKISYIPRAKRKTFQKKIKKEEKDLFFLNRTISERFEQAPCSTGLPRRWIPSSIPCKIRSEPSIILQESSRLFISNRLTNPKLSLYLANGDYIREKADMTRREARWSTQNSRRWKSDVSSYICRRPYRRIQLTELVLGRRFHPWSASYQRRVRQRDTLFFPTYLKNCWDERKQTLAVFSRQASLDEANFSVKQSRRHHFQRSIHLNPIIEPSFTNSKDFFQTDTLIGKKSWGRWNNPNLPLLRKARRSWMKNWNLRNPFLLGETRRAGSIYRNRSGYSSFFWWKIIRHISLEFKNSKNILLQANQYLTIFNQDHNDNSIFINLKNFFSSIYSNISFDQRTLALIRIRKIQKEKVKRVADYTVLPQPKRKSLVVRPFRFFLLLKIRNLLRLGFYSIQKDFVEALYQIIRRGKRIEIEPEWREWLFDALGIAKQRAGIRIYSIEKKKRKTLVQQMTGLKKEIPFFLDLLIYLRRQKRKTLLQKFQIRKVEDKLMRFRFRKSYPPPLLLVGAPGTGKTRLVRALANEADVPVIYQCLAGFSDISFSSFGFGRTVASQAVQRGFREARSQNPAILFLDEIDVFAMGRQVFSLQTEKFIISLSNEVNLNTKEKDSFGDSQKEKEEVDTEDQALGLGQMLIEIDRKKKNYGLVFFRATNRPQGLDPALIRPGRFHQILSIPIPNKKKRRSLLKLYLARFPILKLSSWASSQQFKKKKWKIWIIRIKGKSPAYFSSLRNLAALYQRTHKNILSFEHRIEVSWNRIESSIPQSSRRRFLKKKREQKITILDYFLEFQYKERRTFFQKDKKSMRKWRQLFFHIPIKKKIRNNLALNTMSILFQSSLKKKIFKNRKLNLFLVKKEKVFERRKFLDTRKEGTQESFPDYLTHKLRTLKDKPNQWCNFEILEPIHFHIFSWIPFKEQPFHFFSKENRLKSHDFYKIDIFLISIDLVQLHQNRVTLDFLVSRIYLTIR